MGFIRQDLPRKDQRHCNPTTLTFVHVRAASVEAVCVGVGGLCMWLYVCVQEHTRTCISSTGHYLLCFVPPPPHHMPVFLPVPSTVPFVSFDSPPLSSFCYHSAIAHTTKLIERNARGEAVDHFMEIRRMIKMINPTFIKNSSLQIHLHWAIWLSQNKQNAKVSMSAEGIDIGKK